MFRVALFDPGTSNNTIEGDYVGTNAAGNAILGSLGNTQDGIVLDGTSGNLVAFVTVANSGLYGVVTMAGDTDGLSSITSTFFNNKDGDFLAE